MCRRRTVYGLWVYAPKTRSRSASEAGCPFVCHSPHYCCPPPASRPHIRASLRRKQPVRWVLTPPLLPASGGQTAPQGLRVGWKRRAEGVWRFETRSRSVSDAAVLGSLPAAAYQVPASSNGSDYLYTSGFVCHREDAVHYGC